MATFELFSKRQKVQRGDIPEVFTYTVLPEPLRVQILQIAKDAFGVSKYNDYHEFGLEQTYKHIHDILCREYGVFELQNRYDRYEDRLKYHFLTTKDIEKSLDLVELNFRYITEVIKPQYQEYCSFVSVRMSPDESVQELNTRFREHGIGFQYENNQIIRIDSTFIHAEITKPALSLLNHSKFSGPNDEYLKAHDHYKHGNNKECLVECLKALESTIKVIFDQKGWSYEKTDSAAKLIKKCFDYELVPTYSQNQFTSLRNLIESGIPTIRNKVGGHGQGAVPESVDDRLTRYGMNLTGTNIIFLIEQANI